VVFRRFSRFFHDLSSKTCFLGKSSEVKEGRFFSFFGVFIIIFLKIFPAHVPKGGIFPVISQFRLSSNRFSRFFHDFFRKSRNITKYQFLLNQPFLASNQDKKLVLRAGLEPTTLC